MSSFSAPSPQGPTDRTAVSLDKARRGLRTVLEAVVLFLMIALAVVVVVGVVFRKVGASLVWYDEVASLMLAWLTYYGAALAALHRGHIGMPTLVDRLSGTARKAVVLLGEACVLAFFVVLAGAGSGKTRVITFKIAHLVINCGLQPWQILAVTFTWLMGLMGFARSGIRQHWHIYEVMRDTSVDAATPALGYASIVISACVLMFLGMVAFIFC